MLKNNEFLLYLLKFLLTFCILYYGTIAWIGITSPGGYYSAFADHYLDYISLMRSVLLHVSKFVLNLLGYNVHLQHLDTLKFPDRRGAHIGYDCIGYGVISFWLAFILANKGGIGKKLKWMFGGMLSIFTINVVRISLMMIAIKNNWHSPFNMNNHTWFNIAAYLCIFTMIYFFDRSHKQPNEALYN